jgi:transcriptional regulator with XRE-family HTH domain
VKTFGETIRELRQARDLSLRDLAKVLDVSAPFLSDIELGRRYPSEDVLTKLAKALRTPVEELRALDPRPPVEDLRRRGALDPQFAVALRRLVGDKVSGEALSKALEEIAKKKGGK